MNQAPRPMPRCLNCPCERLHFYSRAAPGHVDPGTMRRGRRQGFELGDVTKLGAAHSARVLAADGSGLNPTTRKMCTALDPSPGVGARAARGRPPCRLQRLT